MAILTLEDTSGKIECAVFPGVFEKILPKVFEVDAFIRTKGKVEERDGNLNFIVDEIKLGRLKEIQNMMESFEDEKSNVEEDSTGLSEKSADRRSVFHIIIPDGTTKKQVDEVKQLLVSVRSNKASAVEVKVEIQGKTIMIPFKVDFSKELEEWVFGVLKV